MVVKDCVFFCKFCHRAHIHLIIFTTNRLRWNRAISIATIVFISIMLRDSGGSALVASINRVIDTSVGIVVAVVVNYFISRPLSRDRVVKSARDLVVKYKTVLGMLICHEEGVTLSDITEKIQIIEREMPGVKAELKIQIPRASQDLNFDDVKEKIDALYRHIAFLAAMEGPGRLNEDNAQRINQMYQVDMSAVTELAEVDTVFNYHLRRSLAILQELFQILDVGDD